MSKHVTYPFMFPLSYHIQHILVVRIFSKCFEFVCHYWYNWLHVKTHLWSDLLCVIGCKTLLTRSPHSFTTLLSPLPLLLPRVSTSPGKSLKVLEIFDQISRPRKILEKWLVIGSPGNYVWRSWKVLEKLSFKSCLQCLCILLFGAI